MAAGLTWSGARLGTAAALSRDAYLRGAPVRCAHTQEPGERELLERFHAAEDDALPGIATSALPWTLNKASGVKHKRAGCGHSMRCAAAMSPASRRLPCPVVLPYRPSRCLPNPRAAFPTLALPSQPSPCLPNPRPASPTPPLALPPQRHPLP